VLFEEIVNSQVFHKIDFIVFFNKIDLFAEKLSRSSPAVCFPVWSLQVLSIDSTYCCSELPHHSRTRGCPPVDRAAVSGGEESSGPTQGVPSFYVRHRYDTRTIPLSSVLRVLRKVFLQTRRTWASFSPTCARRC
jgi:hypothetical protein